MGWNPLKALEKGVKAVARATVPGYAVAEQAYKTIVKPLVTKSGKKMPPAQVSVPVQAVTPYQGAQPVLQPVPGTMPVTTPLSDGIITAPASEFAGALRLAFDKGRESAMRGQFVGG